MEMRPLGKSGIKVAPWALGGNVFGWSADETASFAILDHFVESGFNLIDTADVYSRWAPGHQGGESETIIGRWLKKSGKRDKVVIATKVAMDMGNGRVGLSKKHIFEAVEESLQRLQTDHIDLYQSHRDDPSVSLEETLAAYQQLIKEGKVKAIGASNYSAERLAEALKVSEQNGLPRYETLQPEYNLYDRENFEKALEPLCLKNQLGVIPYWSLASGFLTGKYRKSEDIQQSVRGSAVQSRYMNPRGMKILKALDQVAESLRATPAQVALAWLMARPSITAPIASATKIPQMDDLAKAANLKLPPNAVELLNQSSDGK